MMVLCRPALIGDMAAEMGSLATVGMINPVTVAKWLCLTVRSLAGTIIISDSKATGKGSLNGRVMEVLMEHSTPSGRIYGQPARVQFKKKIK